MFETGDAAYIANALGVVARARGMTAIAKDAGVTRESLYKALSERGDPRSSTLLGVAKETARQEQRNAILTLEATAAARVDIAAPGGSLDSTPLRPMSNREINYASMSDDEILGM